MAVGQTVNHCSYQPPHEGESWCFYSNVKLGFQGGGLSVATLPASLSFGKGCSSISDKDGNLMFYSDGKNLWDRGSYLLSSLLDGYSACTQSSLFVPDPAGNKLYYIFTTHLLKTPGLITKGLNYSVLDMAKATDTLPVTRLLDETAEKLTGVKHGNGHDYWVVAHEWGNNSFVSYKVTAKGVDSLPVISSVGMIYSGNYASRNSVGYMKLSTDGSRLALAVFGAKIVEWFDFDNQTGMVSNARQIVSPDSGYPYGIEFSPDGTKLYFSSVLNPTTNSNNNLYQVDLIAGTPPVLLNRLVYDITALQLAVDGKIYGTNYTKSFLSVIENPNRADTACNLKENGLNVAGSSKMLGLPNFIQSFFDIPAINYDTKCDGDQTGFVLTNASNIDSIRWDFGDVTTGIANSDTLIRPDHRFSVSGNYQVKTKEWFNGRSFESSVNVTIHKLPPKSFLPIPDSLYILPRSAIILDGGPGMESYLWTDGSGMQTLEVSEPGYYSVTIIDTNCCQQGDTIKIVLLDLLVPTAFSPNRDLLNDRFHVKGPSDGIVNYHFYIYSRWGQLLWECNSLDDSWDGTFSGKECPVGVYNWVMKFGVTGNLLKRDKVEKRGVLTLVK
jgi:gliding motility-associated-like protein